jgi:hypothetical protein
VHFSLIAGLFNSASELKLIFSLLEIAMSYISRQSLERVLQSARTFQEHGQRFERVSGLLKESALTELQSDLVRCSAQQIQDQGRAIAALMEQALQEDEHYWLDRYTLAHHHQYQAVMQYFLSIELLLQAVQSLMETRFSDSSSQ